MYCHTDNELSCYSRLQRRRAAGVVVPDLAFNSWTTLKCAAPQVQSSKHWIWPPAVGARKRRHSNIHQHACRAKDCAAGEGSLWLGLSQQNESTRVESTGVHRRLGRLGLAAETAAQRERRTTSRVSSLSVASHGFSTMG
eukprot:6212488-Pleurochrysis_carterae.AAC.7